MGPHRDEETRGESLLHPCQVSWRETSSSADKPKGSTYISFNTVISRPRLVTRLRHDCWWLRLASYMKSQGQGCWISPPTTGVEARFLNFLSATLRIHIRVFNHGNKPNVVPGDGTARLSCFRRRSEVTKRREEKCTTSKSEITTAATTQPCRPSYVCFS